MIYYNKIIKIFQLEVSHKKHKGNIKLSIILDASQCLLCLIRIKLLLVFMIKESTRMSRKRITFEKRDKYTPHYIINDILIPSVIF